MDFFRLLQATGFVKDEKLSEMKIRKLNKIKNGKYGSLPRIKEENEAYEKPWRQRKALQLNEDFDIISDSEE